jgi:hypothetical protein
MELNRQRDSSVDRMRVFARNLCQFLNRTTLCAHSSPSALFAEFNFGLARQHEAAPIAQWHVGIIDHGLGTRDAKPFWLGATSVLTGIVSRTACCAATQSTLLASIRTSNLTRCLSAAAATATTVHRRCDQAVLKAGIVILAAIGKTRGVVCRVGWVLITTGTTTGIVCVACGALIRCGRLHLRRS